MDFRTVDRVDSPLLSPTPAELPRTDVPQSAKAAPQDEYEAVPDLTIDGTDDTLHVKQEERTYSSRVSSTPAASQHIDDATLQAIASAQKEFNTRTRPERKETTEASSPPPPMATKPSRSKKRSRPKNSASIIPKPPPKRRKGSPSSTNTSNPRRSATPLRLTGHKSSHSQMPHGDSPAPSARSTRDDSDDDAGSDADADADAVYCVCRRPDNHTWMVACDAGCDDWYHGVCVAIAERDGDLLDRYVCPLCAHAGRGATTWKPMCRREGCRRPARLKKGAESKYCSDECGVAFMRARLARKADAPPRRAGRLARSNTTAGADADEDAAVDLGPLGGPLRVHDLKALTLSAPSALSFRALGSPSLPTPPTSPGGEPDLASGAVPPPSDSDLTPAEATRLVAIASRKAALRAQRALLKDRERLVVRARAAAMTAGGNGGGGGAEVCGFDARLGWDDNTFEAWRTSATGRAVLAGGADVAAVAADGDSEATAPAAAVVCTKRRCERHKAWQKLALQDVRFEEMDVGDEMRRVDAEESGILARARARRARKRRGNGVDGEGGEVEVVEQSEGRGGLVGRTSIDGCHEEVMVDAGGDTV